MMKRIFWSSCALLACGGLFVAGCHSVNGPQAVTADSASLVQSFDVTTLDSQAQLLQSAGIDADSANAFFVLRWSKGLEPFENTAEVHGHAAAVVFQEPTTMRDREAVGLDMGEASVANGGIVYALAKFTSSLFGVRYGMFGGPDGGRGPHDGMGGPHGGPGGPRGGFGEPHDGPIGYRDSLLAKVNIPYVGGSTYQFEVTGSGDIAAMALDIQAPVQLVALTSPADRDTIDATQDLTVTWTGDPASNMVLVLSPAFKRERMPGGGVPVAPVFVRVNAAAGSYTIAAQTLQDLLSASQAKALHLHVSQAVVREGNDTTLGKILVSASADDMALVHVQ